MNAVVELVFEPHLPFTQLRSSHWLLWVHGAPAARRAVHFFVCASQLLFSTHALDELTPVQSSPIAFRGAHLRVERSQKAPAAHECSEEELQSPPIPCIRLHVLLALSQWS
jgi:hypothetical protein